MGIEKQPFVNYTLDEDKKEGEGIVFSVRANKHRQRIIEDAKEWFDTDKNSTALWALVEIGHNVLHTMYGEKLLSWLFKKKRSRASDWKGSK